MFCTVKELLDIIDERKQTDEFYYDISAGGRSAAYYLELLTSFTPDDDLIMEADGSKPRLGIDDFSSRKIDVSGILLFIYISHNEDFKIIRLKSLDDAISIMYGDGGLMNYFTGDMIVIENGKRKKYCVRDNAGVLLHWDWNDIAKRTAANLPCFIEWLA